MNMTEQPEDTRGMQILTRLQPESVIFALNRKLHRTLLHCSH